MTYHPVTPSLHSLHHIRLFLIIVGAFKDFVGIGCNESGVLFALFIIVPESELVKAGRDLEYAIRKLER